VPRPVPVPDSYTFTVYAIPDRELAVPAYDATVDPNYVHQLDAIFASVALGSAQIALTADAVPGAISDNGPFNCANAPLAP
jgi:acyl dehydratase